MKKNTSLLLIFSVFIWLILSFMTSCTSDEIKDPEEQSGFAGLDVSPDFKFESFRPVQADFNVIPASTDEYYHKFKIYNGNPSAGGKLITQGKTGNDYSYSVSFQLPGRLDEIYVENSNPDGIFEIVKLPVSGGFVSHTFNTNDLLNGQGNHEKVVIVDPGCGEDCDEILSGTYSTLTLDKKNYCVPEGSTLTITNQLVVDKRASLVICGTATINQVTATATYRKLSVYVSSSGTLEIPGDLNINTHQDYYVFGDMNVNGNLNTTFPFKFYNYGNLTVSGDFNNNTNGFQNSGYVLVEGNVNTDHPWNIKNYGSFYIDQNLNINGSSVIENRCYLEVSGDLLINHKFRNYSYAKVNGTTTVNGGALLYFYKGSLMDTRNLTSNARIKGGGTGYSKINISEQTILNGGSEVQHKMDICDLNGIEINNGQLSNKVVFCEITIPQTACNPGSEGGTATLDSDDDGVVDSEDDFPEDAERAFTSYYPNQNDYATFAFEDLWPGMGDYDFNDLVLDFQYEMVTNAENLIVDLIIKTHVKAVGASLDNGFGLSIPVNPQNCGSVNGYEHALNNLNMNIKGYENGHNDHTVIIIYDAINTIYNSSIFNTVPGGNVVETDTVATTVYFDNPQLSLGSEPYNPFIYVDQERGKEIHLIDNAPTDLADNSYFDTGHDDSDAGTGRWYVTENNLPWAIEIPVSFDYPVEKADILTAYLKFETWALSSGTSYSEWYLDEPGYRNENNIYSRE